MLMAKVISMEKDQAQECLVYLLVLLLLVQVMEVKEEVLATKVMFPILIILQLVVRYMAPLMHQLSWVQGGDQLKVVQAEEL